MRCAALRSAPPITAPENGTARYGTIRYDGTAIWPRRSLARAVGSLSSFFPPATARESERMSERARERERTRSVPWISLYADGVRRPGNGGFLLERLDSTTGRTCSTEGCRHDGGHDNSRQRIIHHSATAPRSTYSGPRTDCAAAPPQRRRRKHMCATSGRMSKNPSVGRRRGQDRARKGLRAGGPRRTEVRLPVEIADEAAGRDERIRSHGISRRTLENAAGFTTVTSPASRDPDLARSCLYLRRRTHAALVRGSRARVSRRLLLDRCFLLTLLLQLKCA